MVGFTLSAYTQDRVGGGGDASEVRVNEIRTDLLSWIKKGGSKKLELPAEVNLEEYNQKMTELLQPKAVLVTFVEQDDQFNEDLQVVVNGKPKTCRGFISRIDNRPNIICNISRFHNTSESRQYSLIHHEYAGLAGLEKNEGAASDYFISNQITDFLVKKRVLRLAVKERKVEREEVVKAGVKVNLSFGPSLYGINQSEIVDSLTDRGYQMVSRSEAEVGVRITSDTFIGYCLQTDVYSERGVSVPCSYIEINVELFRDGKKYNSTSFKIANSSTRSYTTVGVLDYILNELAKIE